MKPSLPAFFATVLSVSAHARDAASADGDGSVSVAGEPRQWHKVTLTLDGPFAKETDRAPNPFTDYRMTVTFVHESGQPRLIVPGYFAADGDAANSSADAGTKWRAHLAPPKPGIWTYTIAFAGGNRIALNETEDGTPLAPWDGLTGEFTIAPTDKSAPDFRARGCLEYVGERYPRFAGDGTRFLKAGADAPETLLAFADFDATRASAAKKNVPLKTWSPHVRDWREGDPVWKDGKGKGLIGALNYLSSKGVNAFSFLPYNAGGDGDDVWPFRERDDKRHYDCSKLDQWGIVFDHATARGLFLHFKLQENEMDDNRVGHDAKVGRVPESLDGGELGPERKLYLRELIARFGHHPALNWNLGEENTQSPGEQRDMAHYLRETDPYRHSIVVHTFPNKQDKVYPPLLGRQSDLTGASLQNPWNVAHQRTLKWIEESTRAGKPWIVANDEQNPASDGVPPDPGYAGHSGEARAAGKTYTLHDIRKLCLWGTLMAGGAGVEYYFGYKLPENDLLCEDFRSRDRSWEYCRIALDFFTENRVPFWEMTNADELVENAAHDNSRFGFAKPGEIYLVYLPDGGGARLDLTGEEGEYGLKWFNPREGGGLSEGSVPKVNGGGKVALGAPPADPGEDWLAVVRRAN